MSASSCKCKSAGTSGILGFSSHARYVFRLCMSFSTGEDESTWQFLCPHADTLNAVFKLLPEIVGTENGTYSDSGRTMIQW